jgi:hypothetical protein
MILPTTLSKFLIRTTECRFRMVLQARAQEADSNYLTVEVAWDGTWPTTDDEARRKIVVREV